jgi:integrase
MTTRKRLLTDAAIKALKPEAARYIVWDTKLAAFGVRVEPSGHRTFVYTYRFNGRSRFHRLGTFQAYGSTPDAITVGTARSLCAKFVAALQATVDRRLRGETVTDADDPGAVQTKAIAALRVADTVEDVFDQFAERGEKSRGKGKLRESTLTEYKRLLKVKGGFIDTFGRRKATEFAAVGGRELMRFLDRVETERGAVTADRVLAAASAVFSFAKRRHLVPSNPCTGMNRRADASEKDRYLTDDELGRFFAAVAAMPSAESLKAALGLILVTAQRPGEVRTMRWEDIDEANRVWTIPGHVAKNRRPHRVPLSALALQVIAEAKAVAVSDVYVFATRTDEAPSAKALNTMLYRAATAEVLEKHTIAPFTPHDLRRTAATAMAALGVTRFVQDRILNHADVGIAAVYDRHAYDAEKREALDRWGARLQELTATPAPVGGAGNVIPLRQRASA